SPAQSTEQGEPLPAGAPTDPYQLTAWCYGAMGEWIEIYDRVKPDLRRIDKTFGSSVKNEAEPYSADIRAARAELKVLADAVEEAEKASAQPIAPQGAAAIKLGQSIWRPAELETRRKLADAWLTWALPDRCDVVAKSLAERSRLLGKALTYNAAPAEDAKPAPDAAEPPAEAPSPPPPAADSATPSDQPPPKR
ncbi:MAG: hypothetical protein ACYC8V_12845, partial [Caulobacteraceae bacterium]